MLIPSSDVGKIYPPISSIWIKIFPISEDNMAEIPPHQHSVVLNSRLSPSRVTYTGIALPHCVLAVAQSWNSPFSAASASSHSQEMRIAEIPVLSYLITSGCHTGRHNPLLFTFTGNNVIHCRFVFARNGVLPPLPIIYDR